MLIRLTCPYLSLDFHPFSSVHFLPCFVSLVRPLPLSSPLSTHVLILSNPVATPHLCNDPSILIHAYPKHIHTSPYLSTPKVLSRLAFVRTFAFQSESQIMSIVLIVTSHCTVLRLSIHVSSRIMQFTVHFLLRFLLSFLSCYCATIGLRYAAESDRLVK